MQEIDVTADNIIAEEIMDWYWNIVNSRILVSKEPLLFIDGFYKKRRKLFRFPFSELKITSTNAPAELDILMCKRAYSYISDLGVTDLIVAMPSIITRLDKEFLLSRTKKDPEKITAADIKLITTLYPEAVKFTTAYQFFIDRNGEFFQAHAEVYENYTLSEYVLSKEPVSKIFEVMSAGKSRVFS